MELCKCEIPIIKQYYAFNRKEDYNICQKCNLKIRCDGWINQGGHVAIHMNVKIDPTDYESSTINICQACYKDYLSYHRDVNRYKF